MVELEDDEFEAMCEAINTYKNQNAFYEAQISKLEEALKSYDKKYEELRKLYQLNDNKGSQKPELEIIDSF